MNQFQSFLEYRPSSAHQIYGVIIQPHRIWWWDSNRFLKMFPDGRTESLTIFCRPSQQGSPFLGVSSGEGSVPSFQRPSNKPQNLDLDNPQKRKDDVEQSLDIQSYLLRRCFRYILVVQIPSQQVFGCLGSDQFNIQLASQRAKFLSWNMTFLICLYLHPCDFCEGLSPREISSRGPFSMWFEDICLGLPPPLPTLNKNPRKRVPWRSGGRHVKVGQSIMAVPPSKTARFCKNRNGKDSQLNKSSISTSSFLSIVEQQIPILDPQWSPLTKKILCRLGGRETGRFAPPGTHQIFTPEDYAHPLALAPGAILNSVGLNFSSTVYKVPGGFLGSMDP